MVSVLTPHQVVVIRHLEGAVKALRTLPEKERRTSEFERLLALLRRELEVLYE
jgi:hypothetical protein